MATPLSRIMLSGGPPAQAPAAIVNAFSSGTFTPTSSINSRSTEAGAKIIASGSTTAGVLKEALNVTGAGIVSWVSVYTNNATSRTARLKITIDGVACFDNTCNATTTSGAGFVGIGAASSNAGTVTLEQITFRESLIVEVASSLTETDGISAGVRYYTV